MTATTAGPQASTSSGKPTAKAIPFVLVGMTGTEVDPALRALGLNPKYPGMRVYQTVADLTAAVPAATLASLPIVALSTGCAAYVAGSLAAGLDAPAASQAWTRAADGFLALCRANRSRTLVLNAKAASTAPSAVRHALLEQFDYALDGQDAPQSSATPSVLQLLAEDLIRREPTLRRMQAELDASTQPLTGASPDNVLDARAVLAGVRRTQDDLQQARDDAAARQQALDAATARIAQLHDTALESGTAAERELEKATTDLARRTAELTKLRQELEGTLAALHGARQEIAELRSSTSWKLTGPIRRVRRLLSRGA